MVSRETAQKEVKGDLQYERQLFRYEILVVSCLTLLVFFRECLWQECRITQKDFWQRTPQTQLVAEKNNQTDDLINAQTETLTQAKKTRLIEQSGLLAQQQEEQFSNQKESEDIKEIDEKEEKSTPPIKQQRIAKVNKTLSKTVSAITQARRLALDVTEQESMTTSVQSQSNNVSPNSVAEISVNQSIGAQLNNSKDNEVVSEQPEQADNLLSQLDAVVKARQNKSFIKAEQLLAKLRKEYSNNTSVLMESAIVQEWQGEFSTAEAYYRRILEGDGQDIGALLGVARLQRWQGYLVESQSGYKKVLQLEANNKDAITGLGMVALMDKDKKQAKHYFKTVLSTDEKHREALTGMELLDKTFVGNITLYSQFRTETDTQPSQELIGLSVNHQFNANWRAGVDIAQSGNQFTTNSSFGVGESNALEQRYQANISYAPTQKSYTQGAIELDKTESDTIYYAQVVHGKKPSTKSLIEGSARLQFKESEHENTLFTVSAGHQLGNSNWRALGQVFYNKTELANSDDSYAVVGQAIWEPDNNKLLKLNIATSMANDENQISYGVEYKHFMTSKLGGSFGARQAQSDDEQSQEYNLGLHFRY